MLWTIKLSFNVDILAFLSLETILATFCETGHIFFQIFWSPWLLCCFLKTVHVFSEFFFKYFYY